MRQSEMWLINLDPTVGAEIRKTRPAIVVNDEALGKLPLRIVVPITDWKDNYLAALWMVRLSPDSANGLTKESAADCFQIRSVSENRFIKKLGLADDYTMGSIRDALSKILTIE